MYSYIGEITAVLKEFLLYNWLFSCYSMPIDRPVHGHMTSNINPANAMSR